MFCFGLQWIARFINTNGSHFNTQVGPFWEKLCPRFKCCPRPTALGGTQDLTNSFSQYGPPSQWITYIFSIPLSRYSTSHLVPSRAPTNITVENHGLNEFLVKWNPLPIQGANGRILGYNVYYKTFKQLYYSFPDNISRINNTNMPRVILPNIRTGVTYIISVAAFTSVGTGPRSYPVYKEKGKYIKPKAKISRAAEKNG